MIITISKILSYSFIPGNHFFAPSLWWGHQGRQQGLFFHHQTSSKRREICSTLVSSFFTIVTRQIHSLRASGVRRFRFSATSGCCCNDEIISSGSSCSVPGDNCMIGFIVINRLLRPSQWQITRFHKNRLHSFGCDVVWTIIFWQTAYTSHILHNTLRLILTT